jgi:hypothetical protein
MFEISATVAMPSGTRQSESQSEPNVVMKALAAFIIVGETHLNGFVQMGEFIFPLRHSPRRVGRAEPSVCIERSAFVLFRASEREYSLCQDRCDGFRLHDKADPEANAFATLRNNFRKPEYRFALEAIVKLVE